MREQGRGEKEDRHIASRILGVSLSITPCTALTENYTYLHNMLMTILYDDPGSCCIYILHFNYLNNVTSLPPSCRSHKAKTEYKLCLSIYS